MIIDIDNKKYMVGPRYDDGSVRIVELKEVHMEEIIYDKHSAYTDHGYKKIEEGIKSFVLLGTEIAAGDYFRRTGVIDKRFYWEEVGSPFKAVVWKEVNSGYSMYKV